MSSTLQLKSRLKSVSNTRQITKTMQSVAASKMHRAMQRSLATQAYCAQIESVLAQLAGAGIEEEHPLFVRREVRKRLIIVVAGDNGLAGAYNINVFKKSLNEMQLDEKRQIKTSVIAVGRKSAQFISRLKKPMIGAYEGVSNHAAASERGAIVNTILTGYRNMEFDAVDVIYTEFRSSFKQNVRMSHLLPIGRILSDNMEPDLNLQCQFEPNKAAVFEVLAKKFIEIQIAQAIFDAAASEHSMRMVAMKNATDNADEVRNELALLINRERQAAITNELSDINNGASAQD